MTDVLFHPCLWAFFPTKNHFEQLSVLIALQGFGFYML